MKEFFREVENLGMKALVYEVLITPSPGLVDRNNSGAHTDMDIFTFIDSIFSWNDYLYKSTEAGFNYSGTKYSEILNIIRPLGIEAEKLMAEATDNVNTHKGAIFIFGILSAAIGSLKREGIELTVDNITDRGGEISSEILKDFDKKLDDKDLTYGEFQYIQYGSYGIRGEVKAGFPSIKIAYEILEENLDEGLSLEKSLGESLVSLMGTVFDSNVVGRRGLNGLEILRYGQKEIVDSGGYKTSEGLEKLEEIDKRFIRENISPGGCADLCGATLFLYWVVNSSNL